ncbi:MAG: hypothetical protein U0L49_08225 [Eubacterium sp.]|nr:hypothetical protein [Eubacterium sp.]
MKKTVFIIAAILAALTAAAAVVIPKMLPPVPEMEAVSTASAYGQQDQQKKRSPGEEVLSSSSQPAQSLQAEEPLDLIRNSAPKIPSDSYLDAEEVAAVTGQQVLKRSPFLIGENRIYAPKYIYRATDYSSDADSSSSVRTNGESGSDGTNPEDENSADIIDANTQVDLGLWNHDIQALYSYAPNFSDQTMLFAPGSAGCSSLTESGGTLYFYGNVLDDIGSEGPVGIYRVPSDGSSPAELLIEGKNIYPLLVQAGWLFYQNGNELRAYSDAEDISCCRVPDEKGAVRYMAAFNGYLLYLSVGEDSARPHAGLAAIGTDSGLYKTWECDLDTSGKNSMPTGFTFDGKILHYFDPIRGIINRAPGEEGQRLSKIGVGPCFAVNQALLYSGRDGIYMAFMDGGIKDGGNEDGGNEDGGNEDGGNKDGGNEEQIIAAEKPFIQAVGMGKILYFEGIKSTRYHLLDLGQEQNPDSAASESTDQTADQSAVQSVIQMSDQDITAYIAP